MRSRLLHLPLLAFAFPLVASPASSRAEERPAAAVAPDSRTCDLAAVDTLATPDPEGLLGCKTVCSKCEAAGGVCVPSPSGCICS